MCLNFRLCVDGHCLFHLQLDFAVSSSCRGDTALQGGETHSQESVDGLPGCVSCPIDVLSVGLDDTLSVLVKDLVCVDFQLRSPFTCPCYIVVEHELSMNSLHAQVRDRFAASLLSVAFSVCSFEERHLCECRSAISQTFADFCGRLENFLCSISTFRIVWLVPKSTTFKVPALKTQRLRAKPLLSTQTRLEANDYPWACCRC